MNAKSLTYRLLGLGLGLSFITASAVAEDPAKAGAVEPLPPLAPPAARLATQPADQTSGAIAEIVNLTKAGVGPEVVKAYAERVAIGALPSAAQLIALKEAGVPSEVSVALMKRASEVRASAPAAPPPGTPAPAQRVASVRLHLGDREGYDFWWYHYAYPRTLSYANARMYGPYASYGSYPALYPGTPGTMPFRPMPQYWR